MSDRLDYYFRQRVSEAELDLGFAQLEQADHDLAADLGFVGVVANAVVSQHASVPDLTVDVSGPGAILDQLGQRIFFSALQNVNVAQDDNGVATSVSASGKQKIVSVFVKFDRALSDPRVDGNSLTVFFRRDESFKFIVAQGAEADVDGAIPPPLRSDAILLADVTRAFGQTQILNSNISTARRQDAFVFAGTPRSIRRGRTSEAASDLLGFYNAHANATADRHPASAVDYVGGGAWADGTTNPATTVKAQFDKLIADLAATTGAPKVGAAATSASPNSLVSGSVKSQLDALLGFVNGHINLASGAHAASAIAYAGGGSWADATLNPATTVEAQLDKLVTDLAGTAGGSKVGAAAASGSPNSLIAGSVKSQLDALLGQVNAHINLASGAHAASAVSYAGGGSWADTTTNPATTVEAQLDKLISDLAATTGAPKIGAAATSATPYSLASGSVKSQLDALLGLVNGHISVAMGAHVSSAISYAGGANWADGTTNPATSVEGQLDKLISDLAAQAGAARIGNMPAGNIAATSIHAAINELDTEKAGLALANTFTNTGTQTVQGALSVARGISSINAASGVVNGIYGRGGTGGGFGVYGAAAKAGNSGVGGEGKGTAAGVVGYGDDTLTGNATEAVGVYGEGGKHAGYGTDTGGDGIRGYGGSTDRVNSTSGGPLDGRGGVGVRGVGGDGGIKGGFGGYFRGGVYDGSGIYAHADGVPEYGSYAIEAVGAIRCVGPVDPQADVPHLIAANTVCKAWIEFWAPAPNTAIDPPPAGYNVLSVTHNGVYLRINFAHAINDYGVWVGTHHKQYFGTVYARAATYVDIELSNPYSGATYDMNNAANQGKEIFVLVYGNHA